MSCDDAKNTYGKIIITAIHNKTSMINRHQKNRKFVISKHLKGGRTFYKNIVSRASIFAKSIAYRAALVGTAPDGSGFVEFVEDPAVCLTNKIHA